MKQVLSSILVILAVVAASSVDRQPIKRSYACPPNFVRLSHRCYFFSKEKATWQDAYYQCHSMHSNLAIIKNSNQDKLIRKTLSRRGLEPLERWLGGRFDWQRKQWKWAASGKPLTYKGFDNSVNQDAENLQWSCIVIDPVLQFRWNWSSCLEEKHFICHKKISTITTNKSRKKLMQQYNTNKLNEIPIPEISNDIIQNDNFKAQQLQNPKPDPFHIEIYPLPLNAEPAYIKREKRVKKRRRNQLPMAPRQFFNSTTFRDNEKPMVVLNDQPYKRRKNRGKEGPSGKKIQMYYKTYKENNRRKHPLHPNPIVEEYNIAKTA